MSGMLENTNSWCRWGRRRDGLPSAPGIRRARIACHLRRKTLSRPCRKPFRLFLSLQSCGEACWVGDSWHRNDCTPSCRCSERAVCGRKLVRNLPSLCCRGLRGFCLGGGRGLGGRLLRVRDLRARPCLSVRSSCDSRIVGFGLNFVVALGGFAVDVVCTIGEKSERPRVRSLDRRHRPQRLRRLLP